MDNRGFRSWRRPPLATLIAAVLFTAGFLLSAIDDGFLALSAVAAFVPGILRELGVLKDKDEFQREAARRAGYHAYLAGGLFTFLMIAWYRSTDPVVAHPDAFLDAVLIVMWFTWLLSSLFAFWGRVRTAVTILVIFGGVWLIFNLACGGSFTTVLMQSLLSSPFFLAAVLARFWPRATGVLLLGAAAFFFHFFGLGRVFDGDPTLKGRIPVIVLFVGPLLAGGLALLRGRDRVEVEQDAEAC